jgi:hypothetical protein
MVPFCFIVQAPLRDCAGTLHILFVHLSRAPTNSGPGNLWVQGNPWSEARRGTLPWVYQVEGWPPVPLAHSRLESVL